MNTIQDAQYARDRYDEMLRDAERNRLNRARQPKQPNAFNQLKLQLADWAEIARPRRNRAQRA